MTRKLAALVIGNAEYENGKKLKNPANDADDVAAKLKHYGFEVHVEKDATHKRMDKALKAFKGLIETHEVALFFFAGHGMQIEGVNYLLGIDAELGDETDAKHGSLSLNKVIDVLDKSPALTKIIVLDACRDNPWERAWHRSGATRGLASVYAPKGTIIGYATSPGELASDGRGRNGAYTDALLQHIDTPDCTIEEMFKRVRNTLAAETGGKQTSWEHTSLSGNFFFNMSLGKIVTAYAETSLADSQFIIDDTRPSHRVIKGLKSRNWYTQNDAIALLDNRSIKKMISDNLFVVGRNIYQAACGGSNSAIDYINHFSAVTSGFDEEKVRALLDGMLFEIFFDGNAKLRSKIKGNWFNEVFALEKNPAFRQSFEFISETLVASGGEFYAIPGKKHEVAVTIATKAGKEFFVVEGVYIDGVNVLRDEGEPLETADGPVRLYQRRSIEAFADQLSQELVVPLRLLKLSYTPPAAAAGVLKVPMGATAQKA